MQGRRLVVMSTELGTPDVLRANAARRVCGWGGAKFCSAEARMSTFAVKRAIECYRMHQNAIDIYREECGCAWWQDEARYPQAEHVSAWSLRRQAPTDSKYLNAGGYLGPADALAKMISAVVQLKSDPPDTTVEHGWPTASRGHLRRYCHGRAPKTRADVRSAPRHML